MKLTENGIEKEGFNPYKENIIKSSNKIVSIRNYITLLIFGILIILIITSNLIWYNYSFSKKEYNPLVTNNMPENPINVNPTTSNKYDNHFNNTHKIEINMNEDIAKIIATRVIDEIDDELKAINCSL